MFICSIPEARTSRPSPLAERGTRAAPAPRGKRIGSSYRRRPQAKNPPVGERPADPPAPLQQ